MRKPVSRWGYAVPVIAVAAGLMFGISARTSSGTDLRPGHRDLVEVVRDGNRKVAGQTTTVRTLRTEVDALTRADTGSAKLTKTRTQADGYAAAAGLTKVSGSAVTVSLNDSSRDISTMPSDTDPNWLLVHQQDVQAVVNALWHGGATSMMLMDQRVVSTSAVRCVGNTLLLQGRVYSPPFTIKAIGDPAKLRAALKNDAQVSIYRQYVDLVGLGYDVKTQQKATFPAYSGALDLKYAKVAQ